MKKLRVRENGKGAIKLEHLSSLLKGSSSERTLRTYLPLASTVAQLSCLEALESINVLQYIIKHVRHTRSLILGIMTNSSLERYSEYRSNRLERARSISPVPC